MHDDEQNEHAGPDEELTLEDLQRVKTFAEIHKIRLESADIAGRLTNQAVENYSHRVVHLPLPIDWKSTSLAITQLAEMTRQGDEPIEIIFHSNGGDVFSGWALFDYIQMVREMGIEVTTVALGAAFSMAGILLQAGTTRVMTPHSWMMIHEVGTSAGYGTTSQVRDEAELMQRLETDGLDILAQRSNLTADQIKERCHRKDWYITADEALAHGFIDEIRPAPKAPVKTPRRRRVAAAA